MAVNDQTQPLTWNVPIVDRSGNPTPEFIRFIQSFRNSINNSVPPSRRINTGHGLTGGGDLSSDRTISLNADLSDLNDVDLSVAPTDGQALGFDAASGKWIAETVGGSIEVDQAGTPVTTGTTKLNFTGSGVTVTDGGSGIADIDIPITPPTVTDVTGWASYTPTVTASSGTITSYTVNRAQYFQMIDVIFFEFDITVTNPGSASGFALVTPPTSSPAFIQIAFGREVAVNGSALEYTINTGVGSINLYNNGDPFLGAGTRWVVGGQYQRNTGSIIPVVSTVTGGSGGGGGGSGQPWYFNPPLAASLPTLVNGAPSTNAPTLTDDSDVGLIVHTDSAGGTGGAVKGFYQSVSFSGDFTIEVAIAPNEPMVNFNMSGIGFRDSSAGKNLLFGVYRNNNPTLGAAYWNDTGFNTNIAFGDSVLINPLFLQVVYTLSTDSIALNYSLDGKFWSTFTTVTRTAFMANPDQVGLFGWCDQNIPANRPTGLSCSRWVKS